MSEFVENLHEVFAHFGAIHTRKMFGGHGIYHDGLMFGLVADDTLYLKADGQNLGYFQDRELPAFEYLKQGKLTRIAYHQAPEEIFDDPQTAAEWAARSFEAALRGRK